MSNYLKKLAIDQIKYEILELEIAIFGRNDYKGKIYKELKNIKNNILNDLIINNKDINYYLKIINNDLENEVNIYILKMI
jgi:hypothetical protein